VGAQALLPVGFHGVKKEESEKRREEEMKKEEGVEGRREMEHL
jgi:hypothetical protein